MVPLCKKKANSIHCQHGTSDNETMLQPSKEHNPANNVHSQKSVKKHTKLVEVIVS